MPAVSKKQQRFFGMVRAAQKGEGSTSPEVAKVASEISKDDAKKFAKTKHKGLPEKKEVKEGGSIINVNTSTKKVSYRGAAEKSPHWKKFKPDKKTREHTKDLIQGKKPKKPKGKLRQKGDTWRSPEYDTHKKYKPLSKMKKESMTHQEALDAGWEMTGEGIWMPPQEIIEGDVHSGQGEKIQKRTKAWMDKKGQKGAPGLDAMKARTAEHKAKRGVKEELTFEGWKEKAGDAIKSVLNKKKEERKAEPATDAGARARRKLKDKEHNKYVSFLPAEDD